ncbi:MAG: pyridoxal phosphate-dependent aminotransferase [Bacteroidia bacterium]|nr:pyridoxal phosphate-dependent aminotransferase [Bacteroidia bacterium]
MHFFFQKQFQLPYTKENIIISTGAKQSLINAIMCLLDPGDEVILPAPYWVSYLPMIQMAEAIPIVVSTSTNTELKITPQQLEAVITPKTKLFILNSPSNPSGALYTPQEIQELATVLEKYPKVYILADEIYALVRYIPEYKSIGSIPSLFERTITINGVSKAFSMTGWRIGFMGAPKWLAKLCEKYQGQITSGANSIAQKAALAAVTEDLTPTYEMVATFKKRRDIFVNLLKEQIPDFQIFLPQGAFYLYPNVSAFLGKRTPDGKVIEDVESLTLYLLEKAQVAAVSGKGFGTSEHIRFSYACSTQILEEAVVKMAKVLYQLQ